MQSFLFQILPSRVVFGVGSLAKLPEEVERLGATKALVLCTPDQRDIAARTLTSLGARGAGIFDQAVMHVPIATAQAARAEEIGRAHV